MGLIGGEFLGERLQKTGDGTMEKMKNGEWSLIVNHLPGGGDVVINGPKTQISVSLSFLNKEQEILFPTSSGLIFLSALEP